MTIESPKQKRGGTNQKNRSAAAQAARKTMLLFHHLVRPLARFGFCARRFCHTGLRAGIQKFRYDSSHPTDSARPGVKRGAKLTGCRIKSGMTIESPKQTRGGTNQKNRSAAAQAARRTILLFHHLVRPLARLGFCWYYRTARFL